MRQPRHRRHRRREQDTPSPSRNRAAPGGAKLSAPLTAVMQVFADLAADLRIDLAEMALAAVILSAPDMQQRRFFLADLSAMHVAALIRKHLAGAHTLPPLAGFSGGRCLDAGGLSEMPLAVSGGNRHRGAP